MSDTNMEDVKDQELADSTPMNQDVKASDEMHDEYPMPSVQKEVR